MRHSKAYAVHADVVKALGLEDTPARKAIIHAKLDFRFTDVRQGGAQYIMLDKSGVDLLRSMVLGHVDQKPFTKAQIIDDVIEQRAMAISERGAASKGHGLALREHRISLGHSQKKAAKLIGVSDFTVSKWENGQPVSDAHVDGLSRYMAGNAKDTQPVTMSNVLSNMFEGHEVRTAVKDDGSIWFVLKDVCDVLGIVYHRDAASRLRETQRGSVVVDTLGGPQDTTIISESGLYSVVLRSRSPKAESFQEFVEEQVLPSIRKTGGYVEAARQEQPALPTSFAEALLLAGRLEEERSKAVKQIEQDRPKVEFFDTVLQSEHTHDIESIAKELGFRSAIHLNQWLHEVKVQFRREDKWELYAEYCGRDYTRNKTEMHGGKPRTRMVWTEKGRVFIHDLVKRLTVPSPIHH
jgi:prophage antirepressor-like protein